MASTEPSGGWDAQVNKKWIQLLESQKSGCLSRVCMFIVNRTLRDGNFCYIRNRSAHPVSRCGWGQRRRLRPLVKPIHDRHTKGSSVENVYFCQARRPTRNAL